MLTIEGFVHTPGSSSASHSRSTSTNVKAISDWCTHCAAGNFEFHAPHLAKFKEISVQVFDLTKEPSIAASVAAQSADPVILGIDITYNSW
jgi:hypothetical protein